jgi:hypothetical protein
MLIVEVAVEVPTRRGKGVLGLRHKRISVCPNPDHLIDARRAHPSIIISSPLFSLHLAWRPCLCLNKTTTMLY